MASTTLQAVASAEIKLERPNDNFSTGTTASLTRNWIENYLLVSFAPWPDNLKFRTITGATAYAYIQAEGNYGSTGADATVRFDTLSEKFDEKTVTYNTAPSHWWGSTYSSPVVGTDGGWSGTGIESYGVLDAVLNGVLIDPGRNATNDVIVYTSRSSLKPYLVVNYSDTDVTPGLYGLSPRSGYIPKTKPNTFSWVIGKSAECFGSFTQTSATFRWRTSSTAAATEISAGTEQSVTVPANTFISDSIQWQVEVTVNTGAKVTSEWFTLSTVEALSAPYAESPANIVLDGSTAITLKWAHNIPTGTPQTKADLQYSEDGATWESLATVNGPETSYIVAAGTFAAGDMYWRVRTYNTDNKPSEWSAAAHCIVIAAPEAPVVAIESAEPRFAIRWEQEGQQRYEVSVNGKVISSEYSPESNYVYDKWLDDGTYIIAVRIQNKYSLWSEYGTVVITVANESGPDIALTAAGGSVTRLSWEGTGYDRYVIYRDGEQIGATPESTFTDNFAAVGEHTYTVRGIYISSGDYGMSNAATALTEVPHLMIYDTAAKSWLTVEMTIKGSGTPVRVSQNAVFNHYSGQRMPTVEIGEAVDKTYGFSAVFFYNQPEKSRAFEAMLGRLIVIKDKCGTVLAGVLADYDADINEKLRKYSAVLTEVAIDETYLNS